LASEGKNLVGVDIGTSAIKVCEIKEDRKGARSLVRFGYHPLPAQTIVDGHIMNAGAIVEGLDRLFHKSKRRDVAMRVSGHSVIIKKITMPLMTQAELKKTNRINSNSVTLLVIHKTLRYRIYLKSREIGASMQMVCS